MYRKGSILLIAFTLLFSLGFSQPVIPEDIKDMIKTRVDNGIAPSIVIGMINADGTQFFAYGKKSMNTEEKVDENTIYEIGSITKTFTGVMLAELTQRGKVSVEDPLQKYLPDGINAPTRNGESIKLVHMSNHTSALPRMPDNFTPADNANPYVDYSEELLYDFLHNHELRRDIGSEFEYSNYAVGLLGHVLARNQGLNYEELMVELIAGPLRMKNTRVEFTPKMKRNLATGSNNARDVSNWDLPTMAGAGAIRSDAVDMLKYLSANMGLNKTELYPAMKKAQTSTVDESIGSVIGLGWITHIADSSEIIWHNGGTGGYRAFAGFTKDGESGVVVLTNSSMSVDDIGFHALDPLLEMQEIKPSISAAISEILNTKGIDAGKAAYKQLKDEKADYYDFSENQLNNLGYNYMAAGDLDKALAVFQLNVDAYPEASNVYDSLGEVLMKLGKNEESITNYKRSIEINPGNDNGIAMLKKMGVDTSKLIPEVNVDSETMDSYLGRYALAPNFVLTVTRDGKQLMVQATGQSNFPVFPKSEHRFYYKVVQAELLFSVTDEGKVENVTLFQNGQKMPGKKMED